MYHSNNRQAAPTKVAELQRLVAAGEGLHLEFKRKATYPDKIVEELIAFANTAGGQLLLGVTDDGQLAGVKYPDEEIHVIVQSLDRHCRPRMEVKFEIIALSASRYIVRLNVPRSEKRPHYFVSASHRHSFVRERDMCIKASPEMREIIRRSKSPRGIRFTFGEPEKVLLRHLEANPFITLDEYRSMAGIPRHLASRKVVLLTLARVIRVTPTEKGDLFSLA